MSNEHFVSDRHPVSCRSAIFEDDGTSAWMYLTEAHNVRPIADTWIHNSCQYSSGDSKPDHDGPPPAPSRYAAPAAVCEQSDEHRWTFKWDETGESVALLKDDQPIAFIVVGQKRGFSRMVLKDGPWGRVWHEDLFRRVFDRDDRS